MTFITSMFGTCKTSIIELYFEIVRSYDRVYPKY